MGRLHGPVVGGVVQIDQRVKFTKEVQSGLFHPWADAWYVDGDNGNASYSGRGPSDAKALPSQAIAAATDNDFIYLKAADYTETAALVLSLNDVQIVGVAPTPMQPHLDIWMAAETTFNPMITVSGRGNSFYNLCFRHGSEESSGVGYATDLTCMEISGRYNYFENVYFYSPIYTEQDVAGTYKGVYITGHNNYFKGCKFGSDAIRDNAAWNIEVTGVQNIFEDCIFNMVAGSTSPFFAYINSIPRDMKYTLFKKCTFYAHSADFVHTPSYAIKTTAGNNTVGAVFDDCNFVNVGQVSNAFDSGYIWKSMYEGENAADTTKVGMIALRDQGVG